ncbi:hypothetical protein M9A16_20030, partial [Acinetobacter baumannii]|uniref:hypothetical protein n=1 Tax=Acinetobacter baumannii TaxID=470 RepID=UPI0025A67C77
MSNQQGFRSLSTFKKELHRLKSLFATVPFAPNSKHRVQVTPAKRGKKPDQSEGLDTGWCDKSPA